MHEVTGPVVEHRRKRPGDGERQIVGGLGRQAVAVGAKGENSLEIVAAIFPPPSHMEREVDLGRGNFACERRAHGAAFAGDRPAAILAATRFWISASAVTKAAFQANRASYLRPEA